MCVNLNLQTRTVIKMAMTEQTVTSCVSNYSGQWLSCTCQRQMSHNVWVTHLHFFCVHKTKWKVSKDEITQLHEYSDLQFRNNFENSRSLYKAEQQRQAVDETRYTRTACMNRVMNMTTLLRSMSKAGRFHINSRLMIWGHNEDMTLSTTNITCENKRELKFPDVSKIFFTSFCFHYNHTNFQQYV